MQSTNHYRLPYLQGSDTVDKLPDALRRFAEGIDKTVYELSQKLEQKGNVSQDDLQKLASHARQLQSLSKDYSELSQAVAALQQVHLQSVKPLLEAWGNLGKSKDTILRPLMDRIAALEGLSTPTLKDNQVQVDFTEETPKIVAGAAKIIRLIKKPYVRLSEGTYSASADVLTNQAELFRAGETFQGKKYVKFGNPDTQVLIFTKLS